MDKDFCSVLDDMELQLQGNHPYIAVGEVGLDYYWDRSLYDEQQEAFERQIEWAARYDLPLMIHSRSAHKELVNIMERHRGQELRGVFHCFGGTLEEAQELLSFPGFALGIGGVLTYKKSPLPEVLQSVPLSRIVIETDSPYLAPVPHRGQRNERSYAIDVLKNVAPEDLVDYLIILINPATGEVCFINLDPESFNPETGEITVEFPFLGTFALIQKV